MRNIMFILITASIFAAFDSCRSETQKEADAKHADDVNKDNLEGSAEKDAKFMVDAANMNLEEIHLSELAYSKASMSETKELASMILTDHGLAGAELTAIAQKNAVLLPTTPDVEATRKYDKLEKLDGADFDKEYADMMKKGHEDAIDKFQKIADESANEELKNFVNSKLPVLRQHLEHAEQCQDMAAKAK